MGTTAFTENTASVTPPGVTDGVVERIADGVAVVLVGHEQEEWNFPLSLLPENVDTETVLILGQNGTSYDILGVRLLSPSVESRLGRELFRRRPIAVPLPQREPAQGTPTDRPSRMLRTLTRQ